MFYLQVVEAVTGKAETVGREGNNEVTPSLGASPRRVGVVPALIALYTYNTCILGRTLNHHLHGLVEK